MPKIPMPGLCPRRAGLPPFKSRPAPGIRLDSGAYEGWQVPLEYDPLIAKLAAWAATREEAIARLLSALGEYRIGGIRTTLGFFREALNDRAFVRGDIDTGFIARWMAARPEKSTADLRPAEAAAVLAAMTADRRDSAKPAETNVAAPSRWKTEGRRKALRAPAVSA